MICVDSDVVLAFIIRNVVVEAVNVRRHSVRKNDAHAFKRWISLKEFLVIVE